MTKIQLVLVDDWELRGDGSGDMRRLQFDTVRRLFEIYERHGLRGSINAEVMQQLNHLSFGRTYPGLRTLAAEWEDTVRWAYSRGHDVQLHLHSQWIGASYNGNRWTLPGEWSILRHPKEQVRAIIREGKQYLESVIQPIDPSYRCVSFRSGAWCIAPSDFILDLLADEGLTFDMSIVGGITYHNEKVQLDYRDCDETFLPYYPLMTDARRISDVPTRLVSVPTFSFTLDRTERFLHIAGNLANTVCRKAGLSPIWPTAPNAVPVGGGGSGSSTAYTVWSQSLSERLAHYFGPSPTVIADLSALNARVMRAMIDRIRRQAAQSGDSVVPVVLENHTKDIGDFRPFEQFAAYVASQPDLGVITLRELHENLQKGLYQPRLKRDLRQAA
jgi:hypothetical protein